MSTMSMFSIKKSKKYVVVLVCLVGLITICNGCDVYKKWVEEAKQRDELNIATSKVDSAEKVILTFRGHSKNEIYETIKVLESIKNAERLSDKTVKERASNLIDLTEEIERFNECLETHNYKLAESTLLKFETLATHLDLDYQPLANELKSILNRRQQSFIAKVVNILSQNDPNLKMKFSERGDQILQNVDLEIFTENLFSSLFISKGEYETTAQYRERVNKIPFNTISTGKVYISMFDKLIFTETIFGDYNADKLEFTLHSPKMPEVKSDYYPRKYRVKFTNNSFWRDFCGAVKKPIKNNNTIETEELRRIHYGFKAIYLCSLPVDFLKLCKNGNFYSFKDVSKILSTKRKFIEYAPYPLCFKDDYTLNLYLERAILLNWENKKIYVVKPK